MTDDYILEMNGISKSFYGVRVLEDVEFKVKPGEVHVLLGENGAGKSTLIKILSGAYKMEQGEILLEGKPYVIHSPREAIHKGVSVIYQEFNLNPLLPIYENIYLGKEFSKYGFINKKMAVKSSQRYMDMIGLKVSPKTIVSQLNVAHKQLVEILKAISADVKVLVLDEPTAAITDQEARNLFQIIRDLKAKGIGIIYISHRMQELFEIGDRCTIMRDGRAIKTVDLCDTNVDELIHHMVGRTVDYDKMHNPYIKPEETVLEVENLYYRDLLKDVSFTLKKGEVLGISGLIGSGRTEVAKCIIGLYKKARGSVKINGKKSDKPDVSKLIRKGVVYLSEDRKEEGLVVDHSVKQNIELPSLDKFVRFFSIQDKRIVREIKSYVDKLHIKLTSTGQRAVSLSGGNQQKVVIAKWLLNDASIYIFDEPTRGIDVGAREEIYTIMHDMLKQGASIIVISSDMTEVLKISDRIMVMSEGRVTGIFDNDEKLTQETLLYYAIGGDGNGQ